MNASPKPKFGMYWAAACGGCDISVLNIHEKILDFDANFEVVFWPLIMDAKCQDVEAMQDGEILLTLFNGAIRNTENEHMARLLRRKSKILVAFGSCACEGSVPALANLSRIQDVFSTAFTTLTTDLPEHGLPAAQVHVAEGELQLPALYPTVRTLEQVVRVDYFIPGCPPESHQVEAFVNWVVAVVNGQASLPEAGETLGGGISTVCHECPRQRDVKTIRAFKSIQHVLLDPNICILEQGVLCSGPATRDGCHALCPKAGSPCIGCYGPAEGVIDFGARLMTAVASVIDSQDPEEIERILDGIPDPAGAFYRFNLAGSLLRASKLAAKG